MYNKATPAAALRLGSLRYTGAALGKTATILGTQATQPSGRYTDLPKSVVQFDPMSCWAAATEAWLALIPEKTNLSQDQLVGRYATDIQSGGLAPECSGSDPEEKCFENFAKAMGMDYEDQMVHQVNASYLIQKLLKGPLISVFNTTAAQSGFYSHAVLVYGVGRPKGTDVEVSFMDPADGGYDSLNIEDFQRLTAGDGATRRRQRPNWVRWDENGKMIAIQARVAWPDR